MMRVHFKFYKDIEYWHPENGAGVKVDGSRGDKRWGVDVTYLNTTKTIYGFTGIDHVLTNYLDNHGINLERDSFSIMDDGRISFNIIEDNDGRHIDDLEWEKDLHNLGQQLFIANYDVFVEIQNVYEPTTSQLSEMFPQAEQMV